MKKFVFALIISISFFNIVNASEGDLSDIKTCYNTNYGYHNSHWHVSKDNKAVGDEIYTDPCETYNDTTLKEIKVNDKKINIDNMSFETYDEKVNISVEPTNQSVKLEYEQNKDLVIGNNNIEIKLTTQGDITKTYNLKIKRNKILSKNNNIKKITIDGKIYKFKNNKIKDLFVTSNKTKLNIKITLDDKSSKYKIIDNNLKYGDNTITISVIAENGDIQEYYINLTKSSLLTDIIGLTIGVLILTSPIIAIILIIIIKNKKKKKYINRSRHYKY